MLREMCAVQHDEEGGKVNNVTAKQFSVIVNNYMNRLKLQIYFAISKEMPVLTFFSKHKTIIFYAFS